MTVSRSQLELAAEQTIEAAAAALVWAGQDSYGVLEHVAGASVERMVESRCAYALFQMVRREVAAENRPAVDEDLRNWVAAGSFEVAALPAPAVPAWADAVREALCDAVDEGGEITMQRDDPEVRRRALHLSVRCHALRACSYWGWEPLPLNDIERAAQIVCSQTAQVNAARF